MIDKEEASQLYEVKKMMETPGWGYCLQFLNLEREKNIKLVGDAKTGVQNEEHPWTYYQGVMKGFNSCVAIFDNLKTRIEEASQEVPETPEEEK